MPGTNYFAAFDNTVKVSLTNEEGKAILVECDGSPDVFASVPNEYSNGCILKRTDIPSGYNLYQNVGTLTVPVWRKLPEGPVGLGTYTVSLNQEVSYSMPVTSVSGTFTAGETVTTHPYIDYSSKVGTFDIAGETLKGTNLLQYQGLAGGTFSVGDTITGGTSGATGVVVQDDGAGSMNLYTTNNILFTVLETISNGGGVTAQFSSYLGDAPPPFWTGVLLPNGDLGTRLLLDSEVIHRSGVFYVVGMTSNAIAFNGAFDPYYAGGETVRVVSYGGGVLTYTDPSPNTVIPNPDYITGGTSLASAISGVSTVIGNDQHLVLAGGLQFIVTSIYMSNNTAIPSNVVNVQVWTGPNRTENRLVTFTQSQINTALTNTTNSFVLAGAGGSVSLATFTQTKTVGPDVYVSMDQPEGSALSVQMSFVGFITVQ